MAEATKADKAAAVKDAVEEAKPGAASVHVPVDEDGRPLVDENGAPIQYPEDEETPLSNAKDD